MIEYKFYKNEIGNPRIEFIGFLEGLNELGSCNQNYLKEIVSSLEQVLSGELDQYDFGYEVYSIECKKDIANVIDTYDGWKSIAEIATQEIYEIMRKWKSYLDNHKNGNLI